MDIDPFEKVFSADIEEQPQTGGEEQLPAGDHILSINWKQLSIGTTQRRQQIYSDECMTIHNSPIDQWSQ